MRAWSRSLLDENRIRCRSVVNAVTHLSIPQKEKFLDLLHNYHLLKEDSAAFVTKLNVYSYSSQCSKCTWLSSVEEGSLLKNHY
jgi:hypothetical protein